MVISDIMVAGPTLMTRAQRRKAQNIEKEISQLREQLKDKARQLSDIKGKNQTPRVGKAQTQAQQQPMKTV